MIEKSKRCAIFAHYDMDCVVDDYVLYYMNALQEIAGHIVFVTDCDLKPHSLEKVKKFANTILDGRHGEYDFGSYKRGLQLLLPKLTHYEELVLCNDSCYGPITPLVNLWKQTNKYKVDFWGITWGRDSNYPIHIQSFFLVFNKSIFTSDEFLNFMGSVKAEKTKMDVVEKYEVGLTQLLLKNGFKCSVKIEDNRNENPPMQNPFGNIENGFPFIKTSLLRENPFGIERLYRFKDYVSSPLLEIIKENLRRTAPQHEDHMYNIFKNQNLVIIHRKFLFIKLTNFSPKICIRVSLLGIRILKFRLNPLRFIST